MKKFLKVFVIVLLVIAVIAGTCYFFFKNYEKNNFKTPSLVNMLQSEEKLSFNSKLANVATIVNSDGTDNRIDLLVTTNAKLDQIVYALSSYHINSNTIINDKQISKALKQVNVSKSLLNSMFDEYNIKKDSQYFNRHTGANDLYTQASAYLINYAKFVGLLNDYTGLNQTKIDIKFNAFDIYVNVVKNTFNNLNSSVDKTVVVYDKNIKLINNVLKVENSQIVTTGDKFSINNNNFNQYYNLCNKTEFAVNLAINVNSVTNSNQTTNEKIATYYFKVIFGL